ncbi:MAG: site-specific DNA-methyltransferase [Chloroflexota bacterium]
MPTLHWIGKDAVVNHHKEVPFHLLKCDPKRSVDSPSPSGEGLGVESGNLLIQGDNLLALKALLPHYAGQVKCIYIDPPYNTGNEGWVYNDNVNSPEMKEWLGKVVGSESEDLSRHDKWLCMMYPRLALLREMLREDGSLWMSIDDNEVHHARLLMDEVFGRENFVTHVIWQKKYSPQNDARYFSDNHDHIVVYAKNKGQWFRNLLPRTEEQDKRYKNPDNDPRGPWKPADFSVKTYTPAYDYPITLPSGRVVNPPRGRCWQTSPARYQELVADNRIWFGTSGNNVPSLKKFLSEVQEGNVPKTIWFREEVGDNQEAKTELIKISAIATEVFQTPKPTRLIERILKLATNPGDLILDSFAGSGTTGHAVLKMNKEDGGNNRRFILVEMDENICKNITAERLRRVIQGYEWTDQKGNKKKEAGLGGGFRYCTLGETLFDAAGQIRSEVTFEDLARHVYFVETGQPLPIPRSPFPKGKGAGRLGPLLGVHNGVAVYLLYNGVMKDKSRSGGNVLTRALLESLPPHDGPKVIYGNGCLLGENTLRSLNVTFKQVPYEIKVS